MNLKKAKRRALSIWLLAILLLSTGCGSGSDKPISEAKPVIAPGPVAEAPAVPLGETGKTETSQKDTGKAVKGGEGTLAVEVNEAKLSVKALAAEVQKRMGQLQGKIPPESLEAARAEIRKGIIDDFVVRSLLQQEIGRRKISAGDKEVRDILDAMKGNLPPGVTMEELLKRNQIDAGKMREEIAMNVQINKLILAELDGKVTVSEKEVTDFYQKNKERFTQPETVRARHILIATAPEESEKGKLEKKAKAEALRRELAGGADFAELARKHSDCPSKERGGDLGAFSRGQMVQPFEQAAFSQAKNAIGPVVTTDFGYHIIQVLEREPAKVLPLDGETKKRIVPFLEQQKQQSAFDGLVKRLKGEANIVVYGQ